MTPISDMTFAQVFEAYERGWLAELMFSGTIPANHIRCMIPFCSATIERDALPAADRASGGHICRHHLIFAPWSMRADIRDASGAERYAAWVRMKGRVVETMGGLR